MDTRAAIERLKSFYELEKNWDSYGARPIEPFAVNKAIELLEGLFVAPRADGGVQITLNEVVDIYIDNQGGVFIELE